MLEREVRMEIMVLQRQGLSRRKIAARLGIHRETVRRCLERGGGPPAGERGRAPSRLTAFAERVKAWMEEDEYTATWMHLRLKALGFAGGVRAVQRFVRGVRDRLVRKAFLRFETEPGQQAQVDFAELTVENEAGVVVAKYHMFLMVLGFSRKRYAELLLKPDLTSFMEAHQRAFRFFGGVPAEILYDCMKNVVNRVRGKEPQWNSGFFSFALHCGFAPRLCPPYASWVKGKVERPIRFIREGFWRGYRCAGLEPGNRDLIAWLLEQESRVHGTTCQSIAERFEAERGHLGSLPRSDFDTSARHWRNVGKDCLVHFERNRFMVPHRAVGKQVLLRVKDGFLRIFDGAELLVAYQIPAGHGHLIADPELVRALKEDPEQNRMKYRRPPEGHKGRAKTLGLVNSTWSVTVPVRPIADYLAAAGVSHE
ncbi:MAG TPA: IS21 family transposase [Candidatus Methanoperedens sp.]|nr:IS21 family transposase [Candidatus Methanoperedens sp.]